MTSGFTGSILVRSPSNKWSNLSSQAVVVKTYDSSANSELNDARILTISCVTKTIFILLQLVVTKISVSLISIFLTVEQISITTLLL